MSAAFGALAFTPAVRSMQQQMGSRRHYARLDGLPGEAAGFTRDEIGFVESRDSFFLATVSETGWPYVQHKGGPAGFLKVLDPRTLAFADYRGNRQYITDGNLAGNDRVSLLLIDYANRLRLKVMGRARLVDIGEDAALAAKLQPRGYKATVERAVVIGVEAWDWNCPQHITPRFTAEEFEAASRADSLA